MTSTDFIQISPLVPLMLFYWSRIQSRITSWIYLLCLPSVIYSGTVPQSFFVYHNLGTFKGTSQLVCRMSLNLGFPGIYHD